MLTGFCFIVMTESVSRVLYWTVIYLGRTFLYTSSHLWETPSKLNLPKTAKAVVYGVASGGVYTAVRSPAHR